MEVGKNMRTIIVEHYNPSWPDEFEKIRAYIWPHIGDIALDIAHTGSTSVPGLAAKPVIDFNIIIESYDVFPQLVERLRTLGYEHEDDGGIPMRERFKGGLRDGFMEYHMYVCPKDSPELERQILFRDYLRSHDDARDEYSALKQSLAEKHRHDIDAYIEGKHEFIIRIVDLARNSTSPTQTQNIYDNPAFFDGYKKLRENPDNANLLEEKPTLFSLAPNLTGKTVLDLGCGYGENCTEFKRLGAVMVMGIDISDKMLEPIPDEETIERLPSFESELHKPNFLLIRARKERIAE
jgi:GrpB-like predicted nucleotidyltransferase (UPF0157 family)